MIIKFVEKRYLATAARPTPTAGTDDSTESVGVFIITVEARQFDDFFLFVDYYNRIHRLACSRFSCFAMEFSMGRGWVSTNQIGSEINPLNIRAKQGLKDYR